MKMLENDKRELKGVIGLFDQGLAPLTNALNTLREKVARELEEVEGLPGQDTDAVMARRDKAYDLEKVVEQLDETVNAIPEWKDALEKF
jgi:hypothetical protein